VGTGASIEATLFDKGNEKMGKRGGVWEKKRLSCSKGVKVFKGA